MKAKRRGFTLVELIVVIAILVILAAILIPTFSHSIWDAKDAVCTSNRRSLLTALTASYALANSAEAVEREFAQNKADYACPLDGEISYAIADDGTITLSCTHTGAAAAEPYTDPKADTVKMAGVLGSLQNSGLTITNTFYTDKSSEADKAKIKEALSQAGVDIDSLSSWALDYKGTNFGDYPKFYWTNEDISGITNANAYAMSYSIVSGRYNVYSVKVKDGKIYGQNELQTSADTSLQTYENALEKYNELTGK